MPTAAPIAELCYLSLSIPHTRDNPSAWHPTESEGPFSVLSCGRFDSESQAHAWAATRLNGNPYTVVRHSHYESDESFDEPVHTVAQPVAHTLELSAAEMAFLVRALDKYRDLVNGQRFDCLQARSSDNTPDENAAYERRAKYLLREQVMPMGYLLDKLRNAR